MFMHNALSQSCFFHLRRIRSIKQSLMPDATKTLVHAFVSSRLDCYNSILAGVSGQLLQTLQVIQNAAACLVTGTRRSAKFDNPLCAIFIGYRFDSASHLRSQFWSTSVSTAWPTVLSDVLCELASTLAARHLRSAPLLDWLFPHTWTIYGDRSFAVYGPRV